MSIVTHLGQNLNWTAYKAGHNSFTITFTNGGSAFDISTYTFVVNITKIGDTTNVLQLTEASGITNGGAAGTLAIALTQTQATTTLPGSDYWYEIAYTKDSKVYALLQGTLQLSNKKNPESTTTSVSASVSLAGSSVSAAVTLAGDTVAQASTTSQGKIELATEDETLEGSDTARAVTPANLNAKIGANKSHLVFIQSANNPVIDTMGESTVIMQSNGTTADIWYRITGETDLYYSTADNALLDNWAAGTLCTGISGLFPTVMQYGNTYYCFNRTQTPTNTIYLYKSTDKVTWTVCNGGSPIITGSSTTTDWRKNLYNVGGCIVDDTFHLWVEGNADSGDYYFPASFGYTTSAVSDNPTFTLTATPQVINGQCCEVIHVPSKKSFLLFYTRWTDNSTPPTAYYGEARVMRVGTDDDLTAQSSYDLSPIYFTEIETPRSLDLAADFCIVFTPGKTYPMMMLYNYQQITGYQAYSLNITNETDLYESIPFKVDGQKLRPNFERISLGKIEAEYEVDAEGGTVRAEAIIVDNGTFTNPTVYSAGTYPNAFDFFASGASATGGFGVRIGKGSTSHMTITWEVTGGGAAYIQTRANAHPIFLQGNMVELNSPLLIDADITPSQITANQDNYAPTGIATAGTLRLSTNASRDITGIAAGASMLDGRELTIINVGAQNIVLKNNVTSTAANRFLLGADVTITPEQAVRLIYDGTSSRWRKIF